MVALLKVILVAPVTAVITAPTPQLTEAVAGDELLTVTFAGRLSTRVKFVRV